jgi:hypothetical protein
MTKYGDTFIFEDEDDVEPHLHIVITEPTSTGEVITVSVTTRHKTSDAMVPLEIGDHPYIKRPSVLAFRYAKVRTITEIDKVIDNRDATKREPMDEKFLRRARSALTESEFTSYEVVEFYRGLGRYKDEN